MVLRVLILFSMMLMIPMAADAADSANDFKIDVLAAEGQKNFSEGYFNLDAEPGKNLSLDFRVTNTSDEPLRLQVQPVNAHTADKGGILYSADEEANKDSVIRMEELIDVQKTLTVAANSAEIVHVHLTVPEAASGTLLGGIMLTAEGTPDNLSIESLNNGGSNYTIEQPGQRLVAVKVNLAQKSAAGFSMDKVDFSASGNRLTVNVKNGDAAVLENIQGTYTVMDKDGEVLLTGVVEPFAMAPVSEIDFPLDLKGVLLEEGKYVLMVKGNTDGKEFLAEEKFTVTESQTTGIASLSAESKPSNFPLIIAGALAVLFLLLPAILKLHKWNEKKTYTKLSEKNNL
ncbi:WxL protein peptidoglycan domain-containing protein [Planococcus sp. CAU13]|uniref:WxL protein peptidoglycan domain-containing protein n=1 Tax=Planococcus sp. CAU13 TaxID=1541197 RepID=UPI00052FF8AD|nr:DUF916 domain-containing protein [Planococcus sp. CAU13]